MQQNIELNVDNKAVVPGYEILVLIGTGGIGKVFEARDGAGRKIAVKIMKPTPFLGENYLDSIIRSVELIKRFSQDPSFRLVKIRETGKISDFFYIVMDLYEKGSLEKLVREKSWIFAARVEFVFMLAKSLAKIHSVGLIHGDLKPANIMISENFEPYLNDFYQAADNTFLGRTYSGLSGTPLYMSPEQLSGKFLNKSTDIYSFGIIACEILTGKTPYPPEAVKGFSDISSSIHSGNLIPPEKLSREIDPEMNRILLKALQVDLKQRYANMELIAEELNRYRGKKMKKNSFPNNIRNLFR